MKKISLLYSFLLIIGCQNLYKPIVLNHITYKHNNVVVTRLDYYGKSEFRYGTNDSFSSGIIWAEYSGINDGFKGYLKFNESGKVFLLSGDGYFQSKDIDTSKFEYKRIYAYDDVRVGQNICLIMLSTRYEKVYNNADSSGVAIEYKKIK